MLKKKATGISINDIDVFVFDFDGVLTNNLVHIDQNGGEWTSCSRSDGLAFDVLKKLNKSAYIMSTEKNPVVSARAAKLNIPVLQGVADKVSGIQYIIEKEQTSLDKVFYVGNDLNDYRVMELCTNCACPADSHKKVIGISRFVLNTEGGKGVVREILENILHLDFIQILYPK